MQFVELVQFLNTCLYFGHNFLLKIMIDLF